MFSVVCVGTVVLAVICLILAILKKCASMIFAFVIVIAIVFLTLIQLGYMRDFSVTDMLKDTEFANRIEEKVGESDYVRLSNGLESMSDNDIQVQLNGEWYSVSNLLNNDAIAVNDGVYSVMIGGEPIKIDNEDISSVLEMVSQFTPSTVSNDSLNGFNFFN